MYTYVLMNSFAVNLHNTRSRIQRSPSYLSHPLFLAKSSWATTSESNQKKLHDADGITVLYCSIVGKVSSDDACLSPTGQCRLVGNPPRPVPPLEEAHTSFSLVIPTDDEHVVFLDDFNTSISNITSLVDSMPDGKDAKRASPFLTCDEQGNWRFKFGIKIFEEIVSLERS